MSSTWRLSLLGARAPLFAASLAFGACVLWTDPAAAVIYKFVDEQGRVHFQDHPPHGSVDGLEERESLPSEPARKSSMDPKKGVPFAVVNGVRIHGFSEEAYSRALGSR